MVPSVAAEVADAALSGDEVPAYKISLLGRLYGNTRGQAGQSEIFYENIRKANMAENEIRGRIDDHKDVTAYLKEHPNAQTMAELGNAYQHKVDKLKDYRRQVVRQGLPKAMVREVDERIGEMMKEFNHKILKSDR